MLWRRYLNLFVIFLVGSLLTLVEGLAQQRQQLTPAATSKGNQQLENVDQPKERLAINSAPVKVDEATKAGADAAVLTQPHEPEPSAKLLALPEGLFLPRADQLSPLDKAYLDAFSILRQDNSCSRFYGGPRVIEVLNELKMRLKPTYMDKDIAVRMSGSTISITSLAYDVKYRVFDKAELNLKGSFYRGNNFPNEETVPSVGGFQPNTREVRVTILLHELGHLVEKDKQWLLPNDGKSESQSYQNTKRVLAVCGDQIRELHSTSFESELAAARLSKPGAGVQVDVQQ